MGGDARDVGDARDGAQCPAALHGAIPEKKAREIGNRKNMTRKSKKGLEGQGSDPTKTPPPYRETPVAQPLSQCVFCGIADHFFP